MPLPALDSLELVGIEEISSRDLLVLLLLTSISQILTLY